MGQPLLDYVALCDVVEPTVLVFHQVMTRGGWVRIEWHRVVRGIEVERLLRKFRIPICGRGLTLCSPEYPWGTLYCYVKKWQARWAEYILQRKGIPLVHKPFDPRNAIWAARWNGIPVPAWEDRPKGAQPDRDRRGQCYQ